MSEQLTIDRFFLTDEEKIVNFLSQVGGRIKIRIGYEDADCRQFFGIDFAGVQRALKNLRRQGVANIRSRIDDGRGQEAYRLIFLQPKMKQMVQSPEFQRPIEA